MRLITLILIIYSYPIQARFNVKILPTTNQFPEDNPVVPGFSPWILIPHYPMSLNTNRMHQPIVF